MRLLALRGGGGSGRVIGSIRGGGSVGGRRYNLPWSRRSFPSSPTGCLLLFYSLRTRSLKVPGESTAVLQRLTNSRSFSTINNPLQLTSTALTPSSARRPLLYTSVKLASSQQQRDHRGHSHGHHHHHDNTYLTSKNKADAGVRITRLGLYTNVGMAISKGIGGWYFNSQALVRVPERAEEKERLG